MTRGSPRGLLKHDLDVHDLDVQVVVLDKLDYCASLKNLDSLKGRPNFKVRSLQAICLAPLSCVLKSFSGAVC